MDDDSDNAARNRAKRSRRVCQSAAKELSIVDLQVYRCVRPARGEEANEDRALWLVYRTYGKMMLNIASARLGDQDLADDAVQEVLWGLWQSLHRKDEPFALRPYLIRATLNAVTDIRERSATVLRGLRTYHSAFAVDVLGVTHADELLDEGAPLMARSLDKALAELPAHLRRTLQYRLAGLTAKETARMLSLSPGTVDVYVCEARRRLMEWYRGRSPKGGSNA
jgi:RNA polymerase sigma factor (sigma-70 family)